MKPIIGLLRKEDGPVTWTSACTKALNDVISAIECSGLMLARFDQPFIITTDFSYEGLGAVLS